MVNIVEVDENVTLDKQCGTEVGPVGIAFDSINGNLYVTNINSDSVSVIDGSTNEVVDTIPVGTAPQGIAFNSVNNKMYVTSGTGSVSIIDSLTNRVVEILPVSFGLVIT